MIFNLKRTENKFNMGGNTLWTRLDTARMLSAAPSPIEAHEPRLTLTFSLSLSVLPHEEALDRRLLQEPAAATWNCLAGLSIRLATDLSEVIDYSAAAAWNRLADLSIHLVDALSEVIDSATAAAWSGWLAACWRFCVCAHAGVCVCAWCLAAC